MVMVRRCVGLCRVVRNVVCVCVHVYFHLNVLQKELLLFTSTVEGCIRQADKEGV